METPLASYNIYKHKMYVYCNTVQLFILVCRIPIYIYKEPIIFKIYTCIYLHILQVGTDRIHDLSCFPHIEVNSASNNFIKMYVIITNLHRPSIEYDVQQLLRPNKYRRDDDSTASTRTIPTCYPLNALNVSTKEMKTKKVGMRVVHRTTDSFRRLNIYVNRVIGQCSEEDSPCKHP